MRGLNKFRLAAGLTCGFLVAILLSPSAGAEPNSPLGYANGCTFVIGHYDWDGVHADQPTVTAYGVSGCSGYATTYAQWDFGQVVSIVGRSNVGCARAVGWMNGVKQGDGSCSV